jgi:hypothetical protein
MRWGGEFRYLRLDGLSNSNPRGSFVFTGLYTSLIANGRAVPGTGLYFADFLLGDSQQASVQYGPGTIKLRGTDWNLFLQDDFRMRGNLTLNYGLRYETSPYYESGNHLVNLDVNSDFTPPCRSWPAAPASSPVRFRPAWSGRSQQRRAAHRLAWPRAGTIVRVWDQLQPGVRFDCAASRRTAAICRYVHEPRHRDDPLLVVDLRGDRQQFRYDKFVGIDRAYNLGVAQIWNADVQKDLPRNLTINFGYTGTHGTSSTCSAPNRDPDGARASRRPAISLGRPRALDASTLSVRARKRLSRGISFGGSYAWAHAYDNASSFGTGSGTVAQNDQDLGAEWGRSSFERRHSFNADSTIELPWGTGRRWLNNNGTLSHLFGGWVWSGVLTMQSGAPYTPRVVGSFRDVASGVNGTLRADYTGAPIYLSDPTTLRFFNTDAFVVPVAGTFGNAPRLHHRPWVAQREHERVEERQPPRNRGVTIRVAANNLQHRAVLVDRHDKSADLRSGDGRRPMRSAQLNLRFRSDHGCCSSFRLGPFAARRSRPLVMPSSSQRRSRRRGRACSSAGRFSRPASS